jgi:hypothetical protein
MQPTPPAAVRGRVDLPLNGRDCIQLALLSAGTSEPAAGARMSGFPGNGMRATQNNCEPDSRGNPSTTGSPDRPNVLRNPILDKSQRTISRWFDTAAFVANAPFTYGNAGRNLLEGPGLVNFDLAIYKYFRITESMRLQFRAEAFNSVNAPAFGLPSAQVGDPNFGIISGVDRPRNLQMGLKFIF